MIIAAEYSFNQGKESIEKCFPEHLAEIIKVINSVDATVCRTKASKEITMPGKMLYSPVEFNSVNMRSWFIMFVLK